MERAMDNVSVLSTGSNKNSLDASASRKLIQPHQNYATTAVKKKWLPQGRVGTLVHLCTVGFVLLILSFSANDIYFMDVTGSRIALYLQLFQFLAKAHDMVVAASLVDIAVNYLTLEICQASGLPLGLLMAPFQIASPTSLFQPSYLSALPSYPPARLSRRDRRTMGFALLIIVATIISAVISPLSAILIVPQLSWWRVDQPFTQSSKFAASEFDTGFTYLDVPYHKLWPASLTSAAIPSYNSCYSYGCPFYDNERIYQWGADYHSQGAGSNIALSEQANIVRYLTATFNVRNRTAVSSTPMSGLSRDLGTMWLWTQRKILRVSRVARPVINIASANPDKPILRPLVQTQCGLPVDIAAKDELVLDFQTDHLKYHPEEKPLPANISYTADIKQFSNFNISQDEPVPPQFEFVDISSPTINGSRTSALGVIVAATFMRWDGGSPALPGFRDRIARAVFPCTMSFYWVPSVTKIDPQSIKVVAVENNPNPAMFTNASSLPATSRPINVNPSYMEALDMTYSTNYSTNYTLLGDNLSSLSMQNFQFDGNWAEQWPALIATALSLQSAAALARHQHHANMFIWYINATNHSSSSSTNLADLNNGAFANKSAPNQKVLGKSQEIRDHPELYTEVKWVVQRFGYAWSLGAGWQTGADVLKHIALAVVLLHLLIVIIHHVFAVLHILKGKAYRCVAWDTPLSLLMLALQTPEQNASRIRGTSAGVDDRKTFRDIVRIEERQLPADDVGSADPIYTAVMTVNSPLLNDRVSDCEETLFSEVLELSEHEQAVQGQMGSFWSHMASEPDTHSKLKPGREYF